MPCHLTIIPGMLNWCMDTEHNTLVKNCQQISFGHGYVKGHLAAAANHRWCREAFNDTYLFSNMIPQNRTLNNSTWVRLENYCRNMIRNQQISNVHVYTGPLYNFTDNLVLEGKRVPSHLFKVIIVEKVSGTVEEPECYVMPNEEPQSTNIDFYRMDIRHFQRDSGLTFIERRPSLRDTDSMITATLQGEDQNQISRDAYIEARITSNVNW